MVEMSPWYRVLDWGRKMDQEGVVAGWKTSMSLNPEAFASYPKVATPEQVDWYLTGTNIGEELPEGAMLHLTTVPLDRVEPDNDIPENEYHSLSGSDWDDTDAWDRGHDEAQGTYYTQLQQAIESRQDVAPLALQKMPDGSYKSLDGLHRASIARHLGLTEFPAYVYDPEAPHD